MNINRIWGLSAFIVGITVIISAGSNIAGISLPDWLIRTNGILGLVALVVLVYTTIRKTRK